MRSPFQRSGLGVPKGGTKYEGEGCDFWPSWGSRSKTSPPTNGRGKPLKARARRRPWNGFVKAFLFFIWRRSTFCRGLLLYIWTERTCGEWRCFAKGTSSIFCSLLRVVVCLLTLSTYILVQHKGARLQDSVIKGTIKGILSLSTPPIPT